MSQTKVTLPIEIRTYERHKSAPFDLSKLKDEFLSAGPDEWKSFYGEEDRFNLRQGKEGFVEWQMLVRRALVLPVKEWELLRSEFPKATFTKWVEFTVPHLTFTIDWSGDIPVACLAGYHSIKSVVRAVVLEKLQGAEYRICAREDCKNPPFKVENRRKEFCSYDCAHLAAVRESRKRAAKAQSKQAKKSPKGKGRK
jgi:hypothetical protein